MSAVSQHHYPLDCPTGRWTMLSTILASSMAFIDTTALNVILPSLQTDLKANGTDLFWVLNSYLLMLASLIIVGGSLGDKLGRVKVFKMGILLFTIGSLLCGLAPNITVLIVFRTLQGIGGAFMIPGSLAIISAVFSKEEKGKAIGTWSAAATMVTICGPVLGGALADIGLWRLIFFINIPLGLVSIYILHFKIPESYEPGASKIDWWGAILLTLSLCSFTFSLLEVPELGYAHWLVIAGLLIGILLLVIFIIVERNISDPMVPLALFRNITFSGVNLLTLFLYGALGGIMLFLSLNIIQIQGYSQFQAGLTFLPFSLIMLAMARKMGRLTDQHGARRFLIMGPTIAGIGMLWLAMVGRTQGPSEYWTTYFPGFIVFAFGLSITVVPLTTAVMASVGENQSGIASGINNSVTRIAGSFTNAILGAVALYLFSGFVMEQVNTLNVSEIIKKEVMEEIAKFGEAQANKAYEISLQKKINRIYENGFLITYRWTGFFSAAMAFLSSGIAFFMVGEKKEDHE